MKISNPPSSPFIKGGGKEERTFIPLFYKEGLEEIIKDSETKRLQRSQ